MNTESIKSGSEPLLFRPMGRMMAKLVPVLWIRIGFNEDPDPGFPWQKWQNCTARTCYIYIKNCNLFIPRPPWRTSNQQENPSALNRENTALQNMTNFLAYFCPPGSGSSFPMRIRIQPTKMNADPDPQHGSTTLVGRKRDRVDTLVLAGWVALPATADLWVRIPTPSNNKMGEGVAKKNILRKYRPIKNYILAPSS
jgi:hypothetical protein